MTLVHDQPEMSSTFLRGLAVRLGVAADSPPNITRPYPKIHHGKTDARERCLWSLWDYTIDSTEMFWRNRTEVDYANEFSEKSGVIGDVIFAREGQD